uniref:VPS9 domain-containing protein n=1 Tax=Aegilops tauschii subsp. strangulata TaxID=200361 RepID=A0A453MGH7_AEGTS
SPWEKLLCMMSCCQVINNLLLNVSMTNDRTPSGADEFLPILIYITIKVVWHCLSRLVIRWRPLCPSEDLSSLDCSLADRAGEESKGIPNTKPVKMTRTSTEWPRTSIAMARLLRKLVR